MENINIFDYLGAWGGGGASIIRLGPSWFTSILSIILIYMSNIEAISWYNKDFLSLCQTQVNENFRAVRLHNRADICITREINNHQFFIYGPQYTKMCIFCYSGGSGWSINNRTSHLYQSTYKIWKQSDKDFLSYRESDEMSEDAAAA